MEFKYSNEVKIGGYVAFESTVHKIVRIIFCVCF